MKIYRGTVRGNVVVLQEGAELPEGQEVEVRVVSAADESTDAEPTGSIDPEEEFLQHLLEVGLITEIRRSGSGDPAGDRRPITVKGKPLSEMVVEERR